MAAPFGARLREAFRGFPRLSEALREPGRLAEGVACTTVSPSAAAWTTFQLIFEPRLDDLGVHREVEQLLSPITVAWRRVRPG